MTAIAEELDRRLQALDPKKAAQAERLLRNVLVSLEEEGKPSQALRSAYVSRTHDSGLMPRN